MVISAAKAVRQRAREELTRQIIETARAHLGVHGASSLSLRAVARDLGMASSAVYRYMPSRDDLLTALIVEAYDHLGAAVKKTEARVPRGDFTERWLATCRAARSWALSNPHEYALIFGSPVPGYIAPSDTIGPASQVPTILVAILVDAVAVDAIEASASAPVSASLLASIAPLRAFTPPQVPDELVVRALVAWTHLFGAISFELFGHRHNVVAEGESARARFFDEEVSRLGALVGLRG